MLVRGRIHTVRGKGKSAFLVLRQSTATVQGVLFVDDATVSKGMVKYASQIPRESIVDVEGTLAVPQNAVKSCSQSEVRYPHFLEHPEAKFWASTHDLGPDPVHVCHRRGGHLGFCT